ncbi:hypothetical protein NDU88_002191 [Pleurodeles waltl]|uniref:Uncharacterized protein n=1 Tax=Pleurodeles waltl TaxID=8319 RepID=A0AAV7RDA1_PLEWA|nr:hypothetical protein NDU88_002191 [Pleurodeles waltl]
MVSCRFHGHRAMERDPRECGMREGRQLAEEGWCGRNGRRSCYTHSIFLGLGEVTFVKMLPKAGLIPLLQECEYLEPFRLGLLTFQMPNILRVQRSECADRLS